MKNLFFAQSIQTFEVSDEKTLKGFVLIAENFNPEYLPTLEIYCKLQKPFYKTPDRIKELWNMLNSTHEILTRKN